MIKLNTILIICLATIQINCFSQEISARITYNVSLNLTVEEVQNRMNAKNKVATQPFIDKINNARDATAILEFDNKHSLHKLDDNLKNEGRKVNNLTEVGAGIGLLFYTENSLNQKNSKYECKVLGKCFLIEQEKPNWEITQESKIIGGYVCYKAIYQNPLYVYKKPIAWFAPQLPFGYGPKFFVGLPGLISELQDNTVTYKAIKIELNP